MIAQHIKLILDADTFYNYWQNEYSCSSEYSVHEIKLWCYRGYQPSFVVTNLAAFSQYKFRIRLQRKDVQSPWSRDILCTTART